MASRSVAQLGSKTALRFLRIQPAQCLASGFSGKHDVLFYLLLYCRYFEA